MISFYKVPANGIGELSTFERKFIDKLDDIKTEINNISKKIEELNTKSDE
jgi:hypothetical protein